MYHHCRFLLLIVWRVRREFPLSRWCFLPCDHGLFFMHRLICVRIQSSIKLQIDEEGHKSLISYSYQVKLTATDYETDVVHYAVQLLVQIVEL